ncbi:MAG: hypothetical protein HWN68_14785 [Desulfobacterales bacterium]|nr:hypothetical protein [Desulfobacterales bacterium]
MVEPISIVLSFVAEKVFSFLAGKVTDKIWSKIQGDPAQKAFKQALGHAIQRYAVGERLATARPLLDKRGLLAAPDVAAELAQVISFEREPNAELIGERWKAAFLDPPKGWNFTEEASVFLGYLINELRGTDVFRPVFDAKSLAVIATSAAVSTESLQRIEEQLETLSELMAAGLGDLARAFAGSSVTIRDQIRDYTRFIEEKTRCFVGRQFVFDAIEQFINVNRRGYFFVRGDPGIGKSAIAAQMVKTKGYVHHFNIRAEGIHKAEIFLKNICAQLIAVYGLKHTFLPPEATQDAGFFNQLLGEVSEKVTSTKHAIIVVDALDEVDNIGLQPGTNTLYLPINLPPGIYIVATLRKERIPLRIECEQQTLDIEQNSEGNIADVCEFITRKVERPGIKAYLVAQGIEADAFVAHLVEKSQGNFMYLRYVLPEIEQGAYKDLEMEAIPLGLQDYYEDHWRRMRGKDEEAWFQYKLPIVMALTVVKKPVSMDLIQKFSKIQERSRIRGVLKEWAQFLSEEQVEYEGSVQKRYRVYHASFHDFISGKEEVADERVNLQAAHAQIGDELWSDLFGDE